MNEPPHVFRNDWSSVAVPRLGDWTPRMSVTVVIPAHQCQRSLDLTLASLAGQTHPAELIEVVVVDDGSEPALRLPDLRPATTRLVRVSGDDGRWGIANACNVGVREGTGELILRLDADMIVHPDHVTAHARWHHLVPYAVTLGSTSFVDVGPDDPHWPSAADVATKGFEQLFAPSHVRTHEYLARLLDRTDDLRQADHLGFLAYVGATVALRRELHDAAGGYDPTLRRGSDTEFSYRLAQAGALFVPDRQARGWHLGLSTMMRDESGLQRATHPHLADRIPQPRWLRQAGGTAWAVPLVTAVMTVDGEPFERVRAAADSILRADERDVRLCLLGPWTSLPEESRSRDGDDQRSSDLRLIAATYRSEPRVRLVDDAPTTAFPSPFLLELPATVGLSPATPTRLVDEADRSGAGLVQVSGPAPGQAIRLWRTSALGRAGWLGKDSTVGLVETVERVFGVRDLSPAEAGVLDLTAIAPADIARHGVDLVRGVGPTAWLPATVQVAGLRSWLQATRLLATLGARRLLAATRRGRRP